MALVVHNGGGGGDDAPLNYGAINPIPLPKTLLLVNNFVVNTTRFLNRFRCGLNTCRHMLAFRR